ncbi:hypothetical protein PR202_ga08096 [Eleusine coracana subsp. coracana]|uniref:Uncharacterized protein n=1 Tax=Eleusine coracana subsp. coracana TaxID=191504 RepID=A0AAV5BZ58_ELECO|nr:hypothetical protein PR202_ga08096 [Eleusine coracana subsp. coracana]
MTGPTAISAALPQALPPPLHALDAVVLEVESAAAAATKRRDDADAEAKTLEDAAAKPKAANDNRAVELAKDAKALRVAANALERFRDAADTLLQKHRTATDLECHSRVDCTGHCATSHPFPPVVTSRRPAIIGWPSTASYWLQAIPWWAAQRQQWSPPSLQRL